MVSAVTIDNFPAWLGWPGRVWLVIMDGDGEWRQGVSQTGEPGLCRDIAQIDEETNIGNTTTQTPGRWRETPERDIAPGLHNHQNSLQIIKF